MKVQKQLPRSKAAQAGPVEAKKRRRSPNPEQTRATIFQSAKKHFGAASYDEVRVETITRSAAAQVAAVSRYFGSKEGCEPT